MSGPASIAALEEAPAQRIREQSVTARVLRAALETNIAALRRTAGGLGLGFAEVDPACWRAAADAQRLWSMARLLKPFIPRAERDAQERRLQALRAEVARHSAAELAVACSRRARNVAVENQLQALAAHFSPSAVSTFDAAELYVQESAFWRQLRERLAQQPDADLVVLQRAVKRFAKLQHALAELRGLPVDMLVQRAADASFVNLLSEVCLHQELFRVGWSQQWRTYHWYLDKLRATCLQSIGFGMVLHAAARLTTVSTVPASIQVEFGRCERKLQGRLGKLLVGLPIQDTRAYRQSLLPAQGRKGPARAARGQTVS